MDGEGRRNLGSKSKAVHAIKSVVEAGLEPSLAAAAAPGWVSGPGATRRTGRFGVAWLYSSGFHRPLDRRRCLVTVHSFPSRDTLISLN